MAESMAEAVGQVAAVEKKVAAVVHAAARAAGRAAAPEAAAMRAVVKWVAKAKWVVLEEPTGLAAAREVQMEERVWQVAAAAPRVVERGEGAA